MRTRHFNIYKKADKLRKRGTKWEQIVRKALNKYGINNQFQYVMKPYIVDFFLYDRSVVLEIDGKQHNPTQDNKRTEELIASHGVLEVVRWSNADVTSGKLPSMIRELHKTHPVIANLHADCTFGHMR